MTETKKVEKSTVSDDIWFEIKDLQLQMFALPNQRVKKHAQRVKVLPDVCHIKIAFPAVLPALENVLLDKYNIEQHNDLLSITRKETTSMPKPEPLEQ